MSAYSRLKIFHYPDKLASLRGDILPPLHVRLKPTNACNHRCSYCAYRAPDLQLGEQMDVRDFIPSEKMSEIVRDLAAMRVQAVTFSGGGEPLVYPHIWAVVKTLAEIGIKFATLTNGSRLRGDVAQVFARFGSWVRVSIDGWDGPSYAKYRGVDVGAFDQVIENMAQFQALGGACRLSACINVDQENAAHVYPLIKTLVEQAGVESIKVTPVIVSNDAKANYDFHKPFERTVRRQVALAQENFPQVEIWNDYKASLGSFIKPYTRCLYHEIRPVIAADQAVYSCIDKAYTPGGFLFSIKDQSFRDGWMRGDWRTKINPAIDCAHHCVADTVNRMLFEYLDIEDGAFV